MYNFVEVAIASPLKNTFTYRIPEGQNVLPGMRVKVHFKNRIETGYTISLHNNPSDEFEIKPIEEILDEEPIFDERLIELAEYVSSFYLASIGEVLNKALPSGNFSKKKKFLDSSSHNRREVLLTQKQQKIFEDINSTNSGAHLIFGVTGSGKTEIYIKLAQSCIERGRSVIFLVPEISLSTHIFHRIADVFGDSMILYHSGVSDTQRFENWMKFKKGEAKIAVGTRSAIFLQPPELGLIIIDEEQDYSYKEHSSPRYNARRIAFYRSIKENALLVLGSATPSIETMYAAQKGTIKFHHLKERYGDAILPDVEIVKLDSGTVISSRLRAYTDKTIKRGNQAVFLLNRRGFAPFVMCRDCGTVFECPNCSIGLNYHKNKGLLCHYCGFSKPLPDTCPECDGLSIVKLGAGTQKIEDLIFREFPDYRVFRLDQDSAKKKGTASLLSNSMRNGEVDILLGTQMVAKGFDFQKVTLAAVLLADIGVNIPDFRANEKIFSMLYQLAGRAGRGSEPGVVIIQTLNENLPIFKFLKEHDYLGFYRWELKIRESLEYPPFSRLARIVLRGKSEETISLCAETLASEFKRIIDEQNLKVQMLGPAQAPLFKVGKNFRYHIILKSKNLKELRELIAEGIKIQLKQTVYLEIDIDPVEML